MVIKKSDLPLQIYDGVVLHDIGLSADKKHILLTQESEDAFRTGVALAIKNEGIRGRSTVEFYEKSLGNNMYQTTSYVNSIADDTKITIDMIEYFVFKDVKNNRVIAIKREDALGE